MPATENEEEGDRDDGGNGQECRILGPKGWLDREFNALGEIVDGEVADPEGCSAMVLEFIAYTAYTKSPRDVELMILFLSFGANDR